MIRMSIFLSIFLTFCAESSHRDHRCLQKKDLDLLTQEIENIMKHAPETVPLQIARWKMLLAQIGYQCPELKSEILVVQKRVEKLCKE